MRRIHSGSRDPGVRELGADATSGCIGLRPRLADVEDISEAERNMKMTHVAPDAV
jgi:hypothetical protein